MTVIVYVSVCSLSSAFSLGFALKTRARLDQCTTDARIITQSSPDLHVNLTLCHTTLDN